MCIRDRFLKGIATTAISVILGKKADKIIDALPGKVAEKVKLPLGDALKKQKMDNEINRLKAIAKKPKLVKTKANKISSLENVLTDVDKWSLVPISKKQKKLLANKSSLIKQRDKKTVSLMRKNGFSKKKEKLLIKSWESETGCKWPHGATVVVNYFRT